MLHRADVAERLGFGWRVKGIIIIVAHGDEQRKRRTLTRRLPRPVWRLHYRTTGIFSESVNRSTLIDLPRRRAFHAFAYRQKCHVLRLV